MDLLKSFVKAITWGVGVGLGFSAAVFVTRTFWMDPGPDYKLDQDRLAAIEVIPQGISIKDGKVAVSVRVVNRNDAPVQQLNVRSVIFENGRPIEQCSAYTSYGKFIKPSEELEFIVFCPNQWSSVAEDSLTAQTTVEQAYDEFSRQRDRRQRGADAP
jgi:hypothetical protein